jgi:hypothetical protein
VVPATPIHSFLEKRSGKMKEKLQMNGPAFVLAEKMRLKEIYVYEGEAVTLGVSMHLAHMGNMELVDAYLFCSYANLQRLLARCAPGLSELLNMEIAGILTRKDPDEVILMKEYCGMEPELAMPPVMLRPSVEAHEFDMEDFEEDAYDDEPDYEEDEQEEEDTIPVFEIEHMLAKAYQPMPLPSSLDFDPDLFYALNVFWTKYCQAMILHAEEGYPLNDMLDMFGLYNPHNIALCEVLYRKVFPANTFQEENEIRDEDEMK